MTSTLNDATRSLLESEGNLTGPVDVVVVVTVTALLVEDVIARAYGGRLSVALGNVVAVVLVPVLVIFAFVTAARAANLR